MRRRLRILILVLGMLLAISGAVAWGIARPPIARLIPPGAHDIRVEQLDQGQWLLTYDAPGARYDWYYTVATRLADSGWTQPSKWDPPARLNTYTLTTPLWIGLLWEQVVLHGEPNHARITVRRWISFPQNPYISYVNL